MFDFFNLSGLFTGPIDAMEHVADEKLKRSAEQLAISFGYSQYLTFLFSFGKAISSRKFIGWMGQVFISMAASGYKLLLLQDQQKILTLAVPKELNDPSLMDSIYWEETKLPDR